MGTQGIRRMSTFGQRLKAAIAEEGLSQSDLASEVGSYPANISWWINGRLSPNAISVAKILRALPKVDARWLLTGDGRESVRCRPTAYETGARA